MDIWPSLTTLFPHSIFIEHLLCVQDWAGFEDNNKIDVTPASFNGAYTLVREKLSAPTNTHKQKMIDFTE